LQKNLEPKESTEPLVFSEKYGQKSFNIQVEERKTCLEKLFYEGEYEVKPDDPPPIITIVRITCNFTVALSKVVELISYI
jgi:hypothetical protein